MKTSQKITLATAGTLLSAAVIGGIVISITHDGDSASTTTATATQETNTQAAQDLDKLNLTDKQKDAARDLTNNLPQTPDGVDKDATNFIGQDTDSLGRPVMIPANGTGVVRAQPRSGGLDCSKSTAGKLQLQRLSNGSVIAVSDTVGPGTINGLGIGEHYSPTPEGAAMQFGNLYPYMGQVANSLSKTNATGQQIDFNGAFPDAYRTVSCSGDRIIVEIAMRLTDQSSGPIWTVMRGYAQWNGTDWIPVDPILIPGAPNNVTSLDQGGWNKWQF